jgi:hypothetical protein
VSQVSNSRVVGGIVVSLIIPAPREPLLSLTRGVACCGCVTPEESEMNSSFIRHGSMSQ